MPMDISDLKREGDHPVISPNAGQGREFCWAPADWGRYGEELKRAFPHVVFHEELGYEAHDEEKPEVRFFERLDDPAISQPITAVFPYPGWKPELVRVTHRLGPPTQYWTWKRYLSPRLRLSVRKQDKCALDNWRGQAADAPIEEWPASRYNSSYRRLLREEQQIATKAFRIAQKLSVRAVPVSWKSLADFREGRFRVSDAGFMIGKGWVSQRVVDWCLQKPQRVMQMFVNVPGSAHGCLPVERVPDSAWGDIHKPKWAQR
jgi:hypothetical protein